MKSPALWVLACVVLMSCPQPRPGPEPEPDEEPYAGPGSPPIPPANDPDDHDFDGGQVLVDAGLVVVDSRCCMTRLSISDQEPTDAVGTIEGELSLFEGGLPLRRVDGGWAATTCHPVNSAGRFWYRFVFDGGVFDAGLEQLPDGGAEVVLVSSTQSVIRVSDREPTVTNAEGERNYYRSVSSCDGLDGGVP